MSGAQAGTTRTQQRLRAWDRAHWADWVVPAVAASLWGLLLASSADASLATRRGLVFVGGPVLLLAGLHARITGYLHAPSRAQLLVLPLTPAAHFAAARARHVRGLALTLALGTTAVVLGVLPSSASGTIAAGLVLDWVVLAVLAALLEPMIPAVSAAWGRRFPEGSWGADMQQRAGGGWTLPETVVHLYAPAGGIGVAAAVAMPLQLAIDLTIDGAIDGGAAPSGLWGFGAAAVVLGLIAWVAAPKVYARGVFEAVPFVAEATRTLAGPPIPESTPAAIARLRDPVLRLLVLSFWRETPAPTVRLLAVLAATALVGFAGELGAAHVAVWVAACLVWCVPATTLSRSRPQRARMLSTLPLPAAQRDGRHPRATALLAAPVALGALVVLTRLVTAA
ncbi:MAG: hypothetical protein AAGA54_26375 [Myxococcota bacterium]